MSRVSAVLSSGGGVIIILRDVAKGAAHVSSLFPEAPMMAPQGGRAAMKSREGGADMTQSPRAHVPRLIQTQHVLTRVHGAGAMGRLNAAVAVRITRIVGTMYCAYVFTLVALVALPAAIEQGSVTVLVNWLSSNFLQLVLLPIIIVGQNVISAAQDARAEADHETLTALHTMSLQQLQILEGQNEILALLKQKAA